jgi:PPOX class probable F420-dependent enzyme
MTPGETGPALTDIDISHPALFREGDSRSPVVYLEVMIISGPVVEALDHELVGFLTPVNRSGQPQTSPIWYIRDDEDLIVYNRPTAARLVSIAANPMVAFNLRGDRRAMGALTIEALAVVDIGLPPADEHLGYVQRYGREIERLGWTPRSFADEFSVGLRLSVERIRSWGLDHLVR